MKPRAKIVGAAFLILPNEQGEILLARRANTGYRDGWYSLPAGHLDEGENFLQAVIRETAEEIGVELVAADLELRVINHRHDENGSQYPTRMDMFYVATNPALASQVRNLEPDKCDDLCWVRPGELPDRTVPTVARAISLALGTGFGVDVARAAAGLVKFEELGWEGDFDYV